MTWGINDQQSSGRAIRGAVLWVLAAAICFAGAYSGFGAGGPWYIFLGSIMLAGAAGTFISQALRTLRSKRSTTE